VQILVSRPPRIVRGGQSDTEVDERVREAILKAPGSAWQGAIDAEGEVRDGAWVTELTEDVDLSAWPEGTRLVVPGSVPAPARSSRSSTQRATAIRPALRVSCKKPKRG